MDDIRKVIKKNSPPAVVLQTLRTALTMPPSAARNIVKDLTRPLNDQKRFIKKFDNEYWKGALIMSEMIRCDDDIAIKRLQKADLVIFEIHGGGFRVGHSTMYMDSFISWLRLMKSKYNLYACIMSVEYGLAPKHKYPGPLNECINSFDYLVNGLGVSPSKIVLSGDSAGGALVLETLMRTYTPSILNSLSSPRENFTIPLPAACLLSSPLVSAETTSESWRIFEKKDIVTMNLAKLILKEYLGLPHVHIDDLPVMRLHHVRKDFERFLPKHVMVFCGDKEVLRDDILDMVRAVEEDGKINIQLYQEHYAHDWFMIHEIIKKKDKKLIAKYDEMFVDFAVKAVAEAVKENKNFVPVPASTVTHAAPVTERPSTSTTASVNSTVAASSSFTSAVGDTEEDASSTTAASGKEATISETSKLERKDSVLDIVENNIKPPAKFELFDTTMKFPKPAQYKPNVVLNEYPIITDSHSSKGVAV